MDTRSKKHKEKQRVRHEPVDLDLLKWQYIRMNPDYRKLYCAFRDEFMVDDGKGKKKLPTVIPNHLSDRYDEIILKIRNSWGLSWPIDFEDRTPSNIDFIIGYPAKKIFDGSIQLRVEVIIDVSFSDKAIFDSVRKIIDKHRGDFATYWENTASIQDKGVSGSQLLEKKNKILRKVITKEFKSPESHNTSFKKIEEESKIYEYITYTLCINRTPTIEDFEKAKSHFNKTDPYGDEEGFYSVNKIRRYYNNFARFMKPDAIFLIK